MCFQGFVEELWFFYGSYKAEVRGYPVGFAYFFMLLVTYFGSLFVILRT